MARMCVGLPARVIRVAGEEAVVETGKGRPMKVALAVAERVRPGDYVYLLGDTALYKIDENSAKETHESLMDLALASTEEDGGDMEEVAKSYQRRAERIFRRDGLRSA
jgi:hydrogenase assembly chaperone HypC/HupF